MLNILLIIFIVLLVVYMFLMIGDKYLGKYHIYKVCVSQSVFEDGTEIKRLNKE